MEMFYVIFERCRSLTQSFFGVLMDGLFNFITRNLNVQILNDDINYKTVEISRINKIPKRIKSSDRQTNKNLHKSLTDYGYDPIKFNHITLDHDNNIIDGYKRLSIIKNMYGNYFRLDVKVVTLGWGNEIMMARKQLFFGFFIILIIIITIISIIL